MARTPVKIKGISWVGVKTDRFEALAAFCKDILGIPQVHARPDFMAFRTADGDQLELFGPHADNPPAQFAANRVVCGFLVDDIEGARAELRGAGVELIGRLERNPRTGYAWQHFRGPDGLVYELTYDPGHP